MSSRFASSFHTDFCYSPIKISKNGRVLYVPCGKCNGCLLQKANTMSFRLGDEIENSKYAIFFTLTYDNVHVPKLQYSKEDDMYHWFSASNNIRFNGKTDVMREYIDFYSPFTVNAPLYHYFDKNVVGYLCKSDIQLYLKLLRKDIYDNFNISRGSFRYYIIGEYGPGKDKDKGKYRPHYHGIIIPSSEEIASYLIEFGLFKSWQMCDKGLFDQYTKFCDSGARHYVTEYVTGVTYLPQFFRETKEIKPFALMSKQVAAIGASHFDRTKVLQDIACGIDEYTKRVDRIERNYIFRYPSQITDSLFPKCSGYSLLSFARLLGIYGYLYEQRQAGTDIASVFNGFCDVSVQDLQSMRACLKACDLMSWTPYHYVEVLVDFYYRKEQHSLRLMYEFQQKNIGNPFLCIGYYYNWKDFLKVDNLYVNPIFDLRASRYADAQRWFLDSFGVQFFDSRDVEKVISNQDYQLEVDSIIENADKSKKANSVSGLSPHIV